MLPVSEYYKHWTNGDAAQRRRREKRAYFKSSGRFTLNLNVPSLVSIPLSLFSHHPPSVIYNLLDSYMYARSEPKCGNRRRIRGTRAVRRQSAPNKMENGMPRVWVDRGVAYSPQGRRDLCIERH